MPSCKEVTELMNSAHELSFWGRTKIRFHHTFCGACYAYSVHLQIIKENYKKIVSKITNIEASEVQKLEDEMIKRISK